MANTRRRSKLAAAQSVSGENDGGEAVETSSQITEPSTTARLIIQIPPDVALDRLASFFPEDASLTTPTPDTIVALYRIVLELHDKLEDAMVQEEQYQAEMQKKDVELEQVLSEHETETADLKTSVEALSGEVAALKSERLDLVSARNSLQAQLDASTTSKSSVSAEAESFRRQLQDVEREKRDLIAVVDRLNSMEDGKQQDSDTLRERLRDARSQISSLQPEVTQLKSEIASSEFKVQTLEREIELTKGENERFSAELNQKSEEFATYRRAKHSEIVTLQIELDTKSQELNSAQTNLNSLQQVHKSQSHQLTQALQKNNELQTRLVEQESTFRVDQSNHERLNKMLEERNEEAKKRLAEVELEWNKLVTASDDRERQLQGRLESERNKVDALEERMANMRTAMERMKSGDFPFIADFADESGVLGTPSPRHGSPATRGSMFFSPTASLASKFQKSGKGITEVYADYVRLDEELSAQKQETKRLEDCLGQILTDIEERAPLLQEQRVEYERMMSELDQRTSALAEAVGERNLQTQRAQTLSDRLKAKEQEFTFLEQQLTDLGRQVRFLTHELAIRDDPTLENVEMNEDVSLDLTDTDVIITEQLTLFKNLPQLQAQNQKLLLVTRQIGAQMEAEEKKWREMVERTESDTVRRATETIDLLNLTVAKQETALSRAKEEAERFRLIVSRQAGNITSGDGAGPGAASLSIAGSTTADNARLAEMNSVLKDMGQNAAKLQEELNTSQRECSRLGASLAKANAQIEYLNERHRNAAQEADLQRKEVAEMQNRNAKYQSQIARLEVSLHQAQDTATEASSSSERRRFEIQNLRSEQEIAKNMELTLRAEVKGLNTEVAQLSKHLMKAQAIYDDSRQFADNDRKRAESQIQSLESQTRELRNQVSRELDRNRELALHKDVEIKDLQIKLEAATKDVSATRELLIATQTNEKHLQARVEDLVRQVEKRSAMLGVYEHRDPTTSEPNDTPSDAKVLEQQVAELRGALKEAQLDLESARSHREQYRALSQSAEDALASLQQAFDEHDTDSTAKITALESTVALLQGRLETLNADYVAATEASDDLRRQLQEQKMAFENDKRILEDSLTDFDAAGAKAIEEVASMREELNRQRQSTQDANEKYQRELMLHAETAKARQDLKNELSGLRAKISELQTSADLARSQLSTAESSLEAQRQSYAKQLTDIQSRCDELSKQNSILYQNLGSVTDEATSIRQSANAALSLVDDVDATQLPSSDLRELAASLKKERDIAVLQLDISKRDVLRLKSTLEQSVRSLEDKQSELSNERQSAADAVITAAKQSEWGEERNNQFNIMRESNVTLRAEVESLRKRAQDLEGQLRKLQAELDPIKRDLRDTKADLEAKNYQITLLQGQSQHWQARSSELLQKYQTIDPEDMRKLKEQLEQATKKVEDVTAEKDALKGQYDTLKEQSDTLEVEKEKAVAAHALVKGKFAELRVQSVARLQGRDNIIETLKGESTKRLAELEAQVTQLQEENASLNANKPSLLDKMDTSGSTEPAPSTGDVQSAAPPSSEAQGDWEAEKATLIAKAEKHYSNAKAFHQTIKKLKKDLEDMTKELEEAKKELEATNKEFEALKGATVTDPSTTTDPSTAPAEVIPKQEQVQPDAIESAVTAATETLRSDLQSKVKELEETTARHSTEVADLKAQLVAAETAKQQAVSNGAAAALDKDAIIAPFKAEIDDLKAAIKAKDGAIEELTRKLTLFSRRKPAAPAPTVAATPVPSVTISPPTPAVSTDAPTASSSTPVAAPITPVAHANSQTKEGQTAGPSAASSAKTAKVPPPIITQGNGPAPTAADTSGNLPTSPANPSATPNVPARGRGRGVRARGGLGGGVGIGRGRGGPAIAAANAAAASSGGVSIAGAAKRPLEEADQTGGELAKRLRPAVQRNRQPPGTGPAS